MAEELQIDDYAFALPRELIAQEPLAERDAARLMVLERHSTEVGHRRVRDLPELLRAGDLLMFNQSRVVPARLWGTRLATGGKWEGLFLSQHADGCWELLSQTRGTLRAGEWIEVQSARPDPTRGNALRLEVVGRTQEQHLLLRPKVERSVWELLEEYGHVPIPPYIRKGQDSPADRIRYQTVFAAVPGSVAAPTAGLHFTDSLLGALESAGVSHAFVTLHVGIGTFLPVRDEQIRSGRLHAEAWEVREQAAAAWEACRKRGGRVIAVGTTTARTLESAAANGTVRAGAGTTQLFIRPPYQFAALDGLITNFHLPGSSLLMLVAALVGRARLLDAYSEAVRERYRFFSYGDAMLIL